ncbi:hypothetical protein DXG01_014711 [Tephrocybe rancida]|nr:hypothetical protein DXG01_014711 [Tephrocybe rancida]
MFDGIQTPQLALAAAILLTTVGALYARTGKSDRKLPPGPRGLPIIGNVLQVPTEHLATYFRVLYKQYGGIVYLNLLGNNVMVVGDGKLARELMDKRSAKYSGRPVEPYMSKYVDPDEKYWGFSDPGATFRLGRKLTTQVMSSVRAGQSQSLHRFEAMLTMQRIMEKPEGFATSIIISAMFGVRFTTGQEEAMKEIINLNDEFGASISNAASIINIFPFLDYIPGPMPWRTRAAEFRRKEETLYANFAKEAIEGKNSHFDTWAQYFGGKDNNYGDHRELLNLFCITATSLQTFVLACMCHPEWIKTAQEQLDKVVGQDRLPNFSDREKMPYLEAVCREALRWRPAARPVSYPFATEDDVIEYNGEEYFIPKGSTIMGVPWIIEHDPSVYPDPDTFNPGRWIDENGQLKGDYSTTAFGWGRRTCPGTPFAERSLWMNVTLWLWTFNIKRAPGYNYVSDDSAFIPDFGTAPKQFPAIFEPRSAHHEKVVQREWAESEKDLALLLPTANKAPNVFTKASGITATSVAARRRANEEEEQPVAGPSGTRSNDNEDNEDVAMEDVEEEAVPAPRRSTKRRGRASRAAEYDSDELDGPQEEQATPAKKRKLTKSEEAKLKAKEKAKAKKKKKDGDSDEDDEEDPYRALAQSWGGKSASPAKPVVGNFEDCAKCKVQFTVTRYTMTAVPGPGFLCHKCAKESGNDPFKKPALPKRKKVPADKRTVVNFEERRFPTLASLCIQLITKHIDDVEALGDIGAMNMDAISKTLSKNRGLTPKNAHLFYNVANTALTLYDATNLPSPALETLVHLNPNLTTLRLDFCGHLDNKSMSILTASLPSLTHLELLGPFLVRSPAWIAFFTSHPSLQTFKITQSPRFDIECMLSLKKHCAPTLTALRLREIGLMNDAFLDAIGEFGKLQELDIADPGNVNECTEEALQNVLTAVAGTLRMLDASRHALLNDQVLQQGLEGARHMEELVLRNTPSLTDEGISEFFSEWANPPLRRAELGRNHELGSKALVALLNHSGERLEELGINGWGEVDAEALGMVGLLAGEMRRLDVGWVREVDDFVVKGWMEGGEDQVVDMSNQGRGSHEKAEGCKKLCEVKVWGCNKVTARCPRKKGISIHGVESHNVI